MTDRDEIELPPLPPFAIAPIADKQTVRDYGRDCYMAGLAAARAEPAKPAEPKVHSKWIELFPDGGWTTIPGLASYQNTNMMLNICWTDDGHVWIDNKRNRELAMQLRDWSIDDSFATLDKAADALDGGVR